MSVYKSLYQEAKHTYEEIGKMNLGSDEHVKTVNCANNMVERLNEHDRLLLEERKLDIEERKLEVELEKLKSEKRFRWVAPTVTVLSAAAYIGTHVWTVLSEREFEVGGHILTSEAGRSSRRALLSLADKVLRK